MEDLNEMQPQLNNEEQAANTTPLTENNVEANAQSETPTQEPAAEKEQKDETPEVDYTSHIREELIEDLKSLLQEEITTIK